MVKTYAKKITAIMTAVTIIFSMLLYFPGGTFSNIGFGLTVSAATITSVTPKKDSNGVYQISSAGELYGFAELVDQDDKGASAVLTADIVVNTGVLDSNGNLKSGTFTEWKPIGGNDSFYHYNGIFDGQGHTISGLYYNNPSGNSVGLFGELGSDGEIKNVGVIDSYFYGNCEVGGVCGVISPIGGKGGKITGCYNTGVVSGPGGYAGGVCAMNASSYPITDCYNTGTVTGADAGGVCGTNYGTITGCYNTGAVSGGGNYVGGVCGSNNGTTTGCYNTGTITGRYDPNTVNDYRYVGGVCADNYSNGTITGCYNTGAVSGSSNYVGGVCGRNNGTTTGCYTIDDEYTEDKFKDSTVCGLLNTALQNANADVYFYQGAMYPEFVRTPKLVNSVYQISCISELCWLSAKVNNDNANYGGVSAVLTADIVVNTSVLDSNGNIKNGVSPNWTPIGNNSNKYTGKFDGQGHKISGLCSNDASANYVGLFGLLSGGEIKNVSVIDSYFSGSWYVGSVCGYNSGTITNCHNSGTVNGIGDYVGGVCGHNYTGTITNCYNTGTVGGTGNNVGGVCGWNSAISTITNCYNTGKVNGSSKVGGVCGYNGGEITICYNNGTVSGTVDKVGGMCGDNSGEITGCYNIGTVSGTGENVGGVCGYNDGGTITGCFTTSNSGACGHNSGTINGCYSNLEGDAYYRSNEEFKNGTVCGLLNAALKNYGSGIRFYQGTNLPEYLRTPNLVKGVYQISCASELIWFEQHVNSGNLSANAELTSDIVINTGVLNDSGELNSGAFTGWTPIGEKNSSHYYYGTFDGHGHTIKGLYFNSASTNQVGLFGYNYGTIKNVGVIDSYFYGSRDVGGVCGYNGGTITNCYNTGTVSGTGYNVGGVCGGNNGTITDCYSSGAVSGTSSYVGGVCGSNNDTITDCNNIGKVSGNREVGGVCGSNNDTITDCHNAGKISGTGDNVGGLCGYNYNSGTITDCYNKGAVSGSNNVGGLCGWKDSGTIKNCYNSGTVDGRSKVGGGCGNNVGEVTDCYSTGAVTGSDSVGGVCGSNTIDSTIKNCYNKGAVSATGAWAGGVCGYNDEGTITNCYSTGAVTGSKNTLHAVGGVCGCNDEGTITVCYSTGTVTGFSEDGIICGNSDGTITNCYFDSDKLKGNAVDYNGGTVIDVEGKTTAQFASGEVAYILAQGCTIDETTYDGSIWGQEIGTEDYPVLKGKKVLTNVDCSAFANDIIVYGQSVSLDGTIGFNIYVSADDSYEWDKTVNGVQGVEIKNGLYKFTYQVAAKDMDKKINFTVNDKIDVTVSVSDYLAVLSKSDNESLKNLADYMSNYGKAAKAYFSGEAVAEQTVTDDLSVYDFTVGTMPEGISYYGSSLILKSETTIRHYFKLAEGKEISEYTFSVDGTTVTPTEKQGYYCIDIKNVRADKLGTSFNVSVNGEEVITNYSALSYVYKVMESASTDVNLKNLVKALYIYNRNALAYINAA
ncbi:MAG: GLUG motif-containing protein [Ruminococcus sp.]